MIRKNVQKERKKPYTRSQFPMKNKSPYISNLIAELREHGPVIFLESQMENHPASTVSYLAGKPVSWIKAWNRRIEIMRDGEIHHFEENPWEALAEFQKKVANWCFGYLGYDLKNHLEHLQSANEAQFEAPDLFFMEPGLLLEINSDHQLTPLTGEIPGHIPNRNKATGIHISPSRQIPREEYLSIIQEAKRAIYEGDYYEINLSHPLVFEVEGDSLELYQAMKAVGPVPFGAYLSIDGLSVCCASPERFLARKADRVWSQPIKGTISREPHSQPGEGIGALQNSEKERAENLMIVDLVRNDMARMAKKKSVTVTKLFEIQSFETVHQMVSTVECRVEEKADSIEIIKACFPMGSMTGAPKIAAMQAIDRLEQYRRGIYSGAIGYIKPNGDFDFNVVIRTAFIQGDKLVYPVGGAITSDSDPLAEWQETLVKARAITKILKKVENPE